MQAADTLDLVGLTMPISSASEIRLSPSVLAFTQTNTELGESARRLSSGSRFFTTGDDTASISAAAGLQTQTSTLRSTLVNGAKATSFLQVASDGLSQIRAALDTLVALTATANQTDASDRGRATLDAQFQSTLSTIDAVVAATRFGGDALFDGSFAGGGAPIIVSGDANDDRVSLALPDLTTAALFTGTPSLASAASATAATTPVGDASQTVDEAVALVAAYQQRLDTVDASVRGRLQGIGRAEDSLLAADPVAEARTRDILAQRQDMAAALLAQTLRFNSGLLDLVARP